MRADDCHVQALWAWSDFGVTNDRRFIYTTVGGKLLKENDVIDNGDDDVALVR